MSHPKRAYNTQYRRERYRRLKEAGMCTKCGKVPAVSRCADCKFTRKMGHLVTAERQERVWKIMELAAKAHKPNAVSFEECFVRRDGYTFEL